MKTLSELANARMEVERLSRDADKALVAHVRLHPIPRHQEARPDTREDIRERLEAGRVHRIGIACDHCRTELVNTDPSIVLAVHPPKIHVGCPGCGWTGYAPA
jgi:hypothetical protein